MPPCVHPLGVSLWSPQHWSSLRQRQQNQKRDSADTDAALSHFFVAFNYTVYFDAVRDVVAAELMTGTTERKLAFAQGNREWLRVR